MSSHRSEVMRAKRLAMRRGAITSLSKKEQCVTFLKKCAAFTESKSTQYSLRFSIPEFYESLLIDLSLMNPETLELYFSEEETILKVLQHTIREGWYTLDVYPPSLSFFLDGHQGYGAYEFNRRLKKLEQVENLLIHKDFYDYTK